MNTIDLSNAKYFNPIREQCRCLTVYAPRDEIGQYYCPSCGRKSTILPSFSASVMRFEMIRKLIVQAMQENDGGMIYA